jgi:hypothetical protein
MGSPRSPISSRYFQGFIFKFVNARPNHISCSCDISKATKVQSGFSRHCNRRNNNLIRTQPSWTNIAGRIYGSKSTPDRLAQAAQFIDFNVSAGAAHPKGIRHANHDNRYRGNLARGWIGVWPERGPRPRGSAEPYGACHAGQTGRGRIDPGIALGGGFGAVA